MSIGLGIVLFVIGAILAFALNVEVSWIDLDLVGYLLMGAGVVVAIIGIALLARRRTMVTSERRSVDGTARERVVSETPDDTDIRI